MIYILSHLAIASSHLRDLWRGLPGCLTSDDGAAGAMPGADSFHGSDAFHGAGG